MKYHAGPIYLKYLHAPAQILGVTPLLPNAVCPQVKSKTVQEVIEFYYDWKKTNHYKEWKKTFIPENRETACVYAD